MEPWSIGLCEYTVLSISESCGSSVRPFLSQFIMQIIILLLIWRQEKLKAYSHKVA